MVTPIYLLSKPGTVSSGFFPPSSLFILPLQTLCSFELICYPAGCRVGEMPSFQGSMNISRYILFIECVKVNLWIGNQCRDR